jgi:hypothetical protein
MVFDRILVVRASQALSLVLSGLRDFRQRVCSPVFSCLSSRQTPTQSVLHSFWCALHTVESKTARLRAS